MEFLGIGAAEFMLLLVFAVIMFGPERLPEISRKVARIVHFVRAFANQATDQLKEELGPEYKDLKLTDLNPKTLVRKTLLADIEEDLVDIKAELDGVKTDLKSAGKDVESANKDVKALVSSSVAASAAAESGTNKASSATAATDEAAASTAAPKATVGRKPASAAAGSSTSGQVAWDDEAT